ncbi:hypothetical protein KUTeg_009660 [Tegillarca granosa]|uniref:F-box domain-containing protein n=1 Tax=Tegillarca granosa TaxID=220873 RepID=A0ABQ9F7N5_TEGGR|nr:hypothetical protein KUTeg_009660 [Tegillarca granosa]
MATTVSTNEKDSKENENSQDESDGYSRWNHLPDIVLLEIYSLLGDTDRLHMATVCRHWKRMFYSPYLWRKRKFMFGGMLAEESAKKACAYLKIFGRHLRVLTVGFHAPTLRTVKSISRAAEIFFKRMTFLPELHLKEFTLFHINMEHYWHFLISRNRVINAVCRFLRRLRFLHTLNLVAARLTLSDGCRVLESLTRGCAARTLRTFYMEDIFTSSVFPVIHKRYLNAVSKFRGLRYLYTNYNTVNGQILLNFAKNLGDYFERLTVTIDEDVSRNLIPEDAWVKFARKCRNIKVSFYIYASGFQHSVTEALVDGIPMIEVDIVSWPALVSHRPDVERRIPLLIKHVADSYYKTLDETLLYLLRKCNRVRELNLYCRLSVATVETLCKYQQEGKIDLHSLNLSIHGLTDEEWAHLTRVRSQLLAVISRKKGIIITSEHEYDDETESDEDSNSDNLE